MDARLWAELIRMAGGRRYSALEQFLKSAPVDVQHDINRLLHDLADEARLQGRAEARKAIRSGRCF